MPLCEDLGEEVGRSHGGVLRSRLETSFPRRMRRLVARPHVHGVSGAGLRMVSAWGGAGGASSRLRGAARRGAERFTQVLGCGPRAPPRCAQMLARRSHLRPGALGDGSRCLASASLPWAMSRSLSLSLAGGLPGPLGDLTRSVASARGVSPGVPVVSGRYPTEDRLSQLDAESWFT